MPLSQALVELETFEYDLIADQVIFDALGAFFYFISFFIFHFKIW